MRRITLCIVCIVRVAIVFGQTNPEKYAATITEEELKKQLSIIAGPEMEGRETGTEGQRKAAEYIANEFKRFGLRAPKGAKNYQQEYPLFYDSITNVDVGVDNRSLVFGKDYTISPRMNKQGKYTSKQIVFVGYGITSQLYDDYAGKDVKGKTVMMFAGEPKTDSIYIITGTNRPSIWSYVVEGTNSKIALAKKNGARAVLLISASVVSFRPDAETIRKSALYYPDSIKRKNANVISLSHAAASNILGKENFDALLSKVETGRRLNDEKLVIDKRVDFVFAKARIKRIATNVVGYLEGTDRKKEYVVLTAHYDHLGKRDDRIYFGADDDGSGTTAVVKMAEAFAQAKAEGNSPRRTIVFMAVSGEEKGLLGSRFYSDNPLFSLKKTSVNLNTDMIGRIDPSRKDGDSTNYVYIIGDDKLSSDLHPITEEINNKYVKLELDRKFNDLRDQNRFYYRSDHYNFARKGVPIIFYFNGTHADYHRATDTVDKINFNLMSKRARLVFHTAWEMANRNDKVKRDIPLPASSFTR